MLTVQVSVSTLFHVAASYLRDATLWNVVAQANGLSDPQLRGITTLVIPQTRNSNPVGG